VVSFGYVLEISSIEHCRHELTVVIIAEKFIYKDI